MVYFQTQNPKMGIFWRDSVWKKLVFFYGRLQYFTAIWEILWHFGIVCGDLVYFSCFGIFGPRKIWQP
jgi:hypothetical protein